VPRECRARFADTARRVDPRRRSRAHRLVAFACTSDVPKKQRKTDEANAIACDGIDHGRSNSGCGQGFDIPSFDPECSVFPPSASLAVYLSLSRAEPQFIISLSLCGTLSVSAIQWQRYTRKRSRRRLTA
jgi:hypothetical protein